MPAFTTKQTPTAAERLSLVPQASIFNAEHETQLHSPRLLYETQHHSSLFHASVARLVAVGSRHLGGLLIRRPSSRWHQSLHLLHRYRLCLSLLVLFLNRGPKSLSMWGVEVGITPGRMKRWRDRHRAHTLPRDPVSACLPPTPLHRCIGLRVRSLNDPHDARLRPFNRHTLEPAAASRCEPTHPSPSAC